MICSGLYIDNVLKVWMFSTEMKLMVSFVTYTYYHYYYYYIRYIIYVITWMSSALSYNFTLCAVAETN